MKTEVSKALVRKSVLQYRRLLTGEEYSRKNKILINEVLNFIKEKRVKTVHTFLAIKKNREPDVQSMLVNLWDLGIKIMISRTNFQEKSMQHFYLKKDSVLVENHLNIPEPMEDLDPAQIGEVDTIFVPLLVTDKSGHRIGYGGGYYDRLLKETKALKVGLSLSPPVDNIIQTEEWDKPLDYLITPFKTYNYG